MKLDKETLMSLKGNLLIAVPTTSQFTIKDIVRLKKAIYEGIFDESYDMDDSGTLDRQDINIMLTLI